MLPRVTITPDLSGRTVHSAKHFSKPASDHSRSSRKPVRAAFVPSTSSRQSATKVLSNATPTRRSFEKPPLEAGALAPGIHSCLLDADSASSSPDVQHQSLSDATISQHSGPASASSSASNLHKSDSELALLLSGSDLSRPGTTTINIGSIPISVPIAYVDVSPTETVGQPIAEADEQDAVASHAVAAAADTSAAESAGQRVPSKLKATSAEFYPPTYLAAAAAATALATAAVASSSSATSSATAAAAAEQQQHTTEDIAQPAGEQQYWQAEQPAQQQDLQQQQWQQQQWQHWQQQQPMPMAVPMFFPIPPYVMAYPFAYHQQQQQHMQLHPIMLHHQQQQQQLALPLPAPATAADDTVPASPAAATAVHAHSSSSSMSPMSPSPSLPADTSSLMSTPTAAAGWALAHSSSLYGSTRPGSSASSVASGYTGHRSRQQQQHSMREAGTVTVSALSCVKDAAGALAKVISRHGSCLLLSLSRPGDQAAQATHVAAKSLAVARFYINAHMAAAGAAGVDAAAVLTGLEPPSPAVAAVAADTDDEVVFMPYNRATGGSSSTSSRMGAAAVADAEPALGFIVAKACAKDLPVQLPPPVGIPACMQDRQQQQQQPHDGSSSSTAVTTSSAAAAAAPLLKAGANTDVNKLSNAIIHNILGCNHVALQLAGAAACHIAMKALIKARARLQRKFNADIVATASFANEDTSSSIGRSTVFLRLDVMRSTLLQQVSAVGRAVAGAVEGGSGQQGGAAAAAGAAV